MRELTAHKINEPEKPAIEIRDINRVFAADDPEGGAHHSYQISLWRHNQWQDFCKLKFQKGSAATDEGANGLTNEALLAIVIDRLKGFQSGPCPHHCNERAAIFCEAALGFLKMRTIDRVERQVEGTMTK